MHPLGSRGLSLGKSNQMLFVTCAEYNRCRPNREMLTYKPLNQHCGLPSGAVV